MSEINASNAAPPTAVPPASTIERMELGHVGSWGNASYLASCMGSHAPAVPWTENMAPARFGCPVCSDGTVTATSHPTIIGILTVACDRGCSPAAVRAACEASAPRAFYPSDDLLVPIPDDVLAKLIARATEGVFAPGMDDAMRDLGRLRAGAVSVAMFPVMSPDGRTVIAQFRANYDEGHPRWPKAFLPIHVTVSIDGKIDVEVGLPADPLPMVGLERMRATPGATVAVAEGEKAMMAAAAMLPEFTWATSLNGASNAHHTDWSPLAGCDVVIVPDNDEAGRHYARSVAAQAHAAGVRSVGIMRWPEGTAAKQDLADALPPGVTVDDVRRWIAEAPAVTWDEVKDALHVPREAQHWPPFRLADGHMAKHRHVVEAIVAALGKINPGCRRWPWLRVLGGIYHALGAAGLPYAIEWSARDASTHGKFKPGEVERIFEAFAINPEPRPMQVVDLFWQAWRETSAGNDGDGWRPDADARADAEIMAFASEVRKLVQGDTVYIAIQKRRPGGGYRIERKSERTAESIYRSRRIMDHAGKKLISVFKLWEVHADTKPLDIVFRPGGSVAADEFNSFQGFDVQPNAWRGSYKLFRELVDRIMADNQDTEGWLWNCAAYRVQRPDTLMNTVPCFVGVQGSGKSKFSEVMVRINAPYSIILQHPERFVGRNNACLEGKLFVMCDDMVLAGREENVEKLRGYTTSPIIDVEDKFKPQSQVENRMWITMSGNRPPVTIGAGERRFAMYWVSDPFEGDQSKRTEHYSKMDAELAAGGLEALMHDLLHHQIPASFDPRSVPKTPYYMELVGEVEDSDPLRGWWRDVLEKGEMCGNDRADQPWTAPVGKDMLYGNYAAWCQNDGSRSRNAVLSKAEWAKGLGRMLPGGLATKRVTVDKARVHVIVPPAYEMCCDRFEQLFRVKIDRAPAPVQLRSVM